MAKRFKKIRLVFTTETPIIRLLALNIIDGLNTFESIPKVQKPAVKARLIELGYNVGEHGELIDTGSGRRE